MLYQSNWSKSSKILAGEILVTCDSCLCFMDSAWLESERKEDKEKILRYGKEKDNICPRCRKELRIK